VSAAQDLASLVRFRLGQESPYVSLWADFEADPDAMSAELTGAMEALVEADPALGRRLEGFVREWRPVTGPPGAESTPAALEIGVTGEDSRRTIALEANEDVGKGAYLYGNLEPGTVAPVGGAVREIDRAEGVEHIETIGVDPSRVARLLDDMYRAIETHPGIDPVLEKDLKAELEEAVAQASKGDEADEDQLARHLRNIGRMHGDILKALLDRLTDPEVGWGGMPQEVWDLRERR
jgi:hypothetical protein